MTSEAVLGGKLLLDYLKKVKGFILCALTFPDSDGTGVSRAFDAFLIMLASVNLSEASKVSM